MNSIWSPIISDEEDLSKCACCRNHIGDDVELFGFGAKIMPGIDLSEFEGKIVELKLLTEDRTVPMMVTVEGSEAKIDGNDVMFMVCSEKCSSELIAILKRETSLGNTFEKINPLLN